MRKEILPAVAMLLITVVLSVKLIPFITGIGHDKQVFIYGSMAIWKGEIPYKAFFDHKPPLIFLLLALAWPFKAWGYFILGVLTKWVAAMFSYRAAKMFGLSNAWLYSVIFLVCILTPFILMDGLLTREYAACFLLALYSLILMYPGKKCIAVGLLCALVFHTQQEELLLAFPFVMYNLFYNARKASGISWSTVVRRCLRMTAGFMIVTVPLLAWLAINDGLFDYWKQAFLFNLTEYKSRMIAWDKINGMLGVLYHSRFMFLLFPLILMHVIFIFRKENKALHLVSLSTILLALFIKTFAGRMTDGAAVYHYLLTISSIVSVAAIIVARETELYFAPQYRRLLGVAFCAGLFFLMWKNAFPALRNMHLSATDIEVNELTHHLQDIKNKDGQIYVMGHTPFVAVNNNLNSLAPTKWIYTSQYSQQLPGFDAEGNVIKEIITGIEKHKTTYIVDFYLLKPMNKPAFQQLWERYLKRHYTEVYRKKDYILLKRIAG